MQNPSTSEQTPWHAAQSSFSAWARGAYDVPRAVIDLRTEEQHRQQQSQDGSRNNEPEYT